MPAANGITNAVSLSRLYAGLIGTVEGGPGEPILTKDQVDQARIVRTFGADQVFASVGFTMEQRIGQGFWIASPFSLSEAPARSDTPVRAGPTASPIRRTAWPWATS